MKRPVWIALVSGLVFGSTTAAAAPVVFVDEIYTSVEQGTSGNSRTQEKRMVVGAPVNAGFGLEVESRLDDPGGFNVYRNFAKAYANDVGILRAEVQGTTFSFGRAIASITYQIRNDDDLPVSALFTFTTLDAALFGISADGVSSGPAFPGAPFIDISVSVATTTDLGIGYGLPDEYYIATQEGAGAIRFEEFPNLVEENRQNLNELRFGHVIAPFRQTYQFDVAANSSLFVKQTLDILGTVALGESGYWSYVGDPLSIEVPTTIEFVAVPEPIALSPLLALGVLARCRRGGPR